MNVAVYTPALVQGDAVSADVFGMIDALNRSGVNACPFSRWTKDGVDSRPLKDLPRFLTEPDDVIIYHHSIGDEDSVRAYESLTCRKIVKYHNITPAHFFDDISKFVSRACTSGFKQTGRLLKNCSAVWVDSDFNGKDMQLEHPGQAYDVLPPFNQVYRLIEAEPDQTAVALHDDWLTNILMVGRLVPNKNHLLALEVFAEYRSHYDPHCRLILVGDVAQNKFCDRITDRIVQLGLSRYVCITGKVTVQQLKALYLTAQILLTCSSHEGFCLPLVEAMGLRVPLVALPKTAIPDTAGEAAWYASESPNEIAAVMNRVLSHPAEREERLNRGWQRYEDLFRNESIEQHFLNLFHKVRAQATITQT